MSLYALKSEEFFLLHVKVDSPNIYIYTCITCSVHHSLSAIVSFLSNPTSYNIQI